MPGEIKSDGLRQMAFRLWTERKSVRATHREMVKEKAELSRATVGSPPPALSMAPGVASAATTSLSLSLQPKASTVINSQGVKFILLLRYSGYSDDWNSQRSEIQVWLCQFLRGAPPDRAWPDRI